MVKIITYRDNIYDANEGFFREIQVAGSRNRKTIYAEQELDQLLNDGWNIIFTSTSAITRGEGNTKLTVILKK